MRLQWSINFLEVQKMMIKIQLDKGLVYLGTTLYVLSDESNALRNKIIKNYKNPF